MKRQRSTSKAQGGANLYTWPPGSLARHYCRSPVVVAGSVADSDGGGVSPTPCSVRTLRVELPGSLAFVGEASFLEQPVVWFWSGSIPRERAHTVFLVRRLVNAIFLIPTEAGVEKQRACPPVDLDAVRIRSV